MREGQASAARADLSAIRAALAIDRSSSAQARTIDLTTTGARSGRAHRIEIWFYRAGDELYLSTAPARRDWYANVLAHPRIVIHLKHGVSADLTASGVPITEPGERARVLREIVDGLRHPADRGGVQNIVGDADDWIAGSPLVRIDLDDPSLLPGR
ncbi:nitroreductase/quinone reductase family protein [Nakamurella leprariae]|uniref:Nitroreductase family deazaflavin-dependent oxidoreductase n=1 Tax=Nakamurella leprariae TaxID=2803911 RepID=A0A938YGA1_9ACTN|nr:nitroreductase/quinone reductase family protein [Nakamurella leprariae]MBM9469048.1 nitroreductase family deazaflavin-dependent oxidoreductase [Nakamurella leprariae]